jgi:7,8-dihydropterin-6-yl-methyl-4-(beta-D-ribofuranosyl)aminobenzene 5'-phosphate synthase
MMQEDTMQKRVAATVLVENTAGRGDLGAEHGFAIWLDFGEHRVLFDTGQSDLVCRNAAALGIDLAAADAVVLSHGHYDHAGGLPAVRELAPRARLFMHADAGVDPCGLQTVASDRPEEVVSGVRTTGGIALTTDFEGRNPRPDDQALFFEVGAGLVVIVGCAHAGVVNTLRQVLRLTGLDRVHAVIGGMHLGGASADRISRTAVALHDLGVRHLSPCHCTGDTAIERFREVFPDAVRPCPAGTAFTFGA